jgi:hypothetical protein
MNRILLFGCVCILLACTGPSKQEVSLSEEMAGLKQQIEEMEKQIHPQLSKGRIRHTVVFNLKYDLNAPETEKFLSDGERILSAIPAVEKFEALRQVSPKNDYHFCFSMEFAGQTSYKAYNEHPDHVKFVTERWETEVSEFMEIDLESR